MAHTISVEVSDEVYAALKDTPSLGRTPEEAAATVLQRYVPTKSGGGAPRDRDALKRLLALAGSIDSGDPNSADNERLEEDLAREYGRDL